MKNFLLFFLCLLPLPARALTITDDLGRAVTLDAPARRVIALYGAFSELVLALGAGHCLAARTAADGGSPELDALPVIGTHMRPNPELIVALRPDAVLQLAGRQETQAQTESLRSLGLNVLTFTLDSFEDIFRVTEKLGLLLDRRPQADARVREWKTRLVALRERHSGRAPVRIFYEVRYPNLLAAGGKGIVQEIIVAAGGENVVRERKKLVRYSEEALIQARPEVYIVQQGPMNPGAPPPRLRPHYKDLAAVRAGRVLNVDEKRFARPGPHAVAAAEELSRRLRPAADGHAPRPPSTESKE
ncbi:MAG: ABC transporter substrate-binding protein [Desulfovibrio sp.]|nr:ABC transporter substrate-binding protein [Desulfovibrio sp.]